MTIIKVIRRFFKNPSHIPKNISWRFPHSYSSQRHIFVVGAPRSGTTLVKLILAAHPNLSGPGYETAIFMYKDIFNFSFEGFSKAEMDDIRHNSSDIVQFFDSFAQKSLQKSGGNRFIEKTPPHVLKLAFLVKYFPQAQFINIFRDGRDCYCSSLHHAHIPQNSSVEQYAQYWKRCINTRLKLGESPNIFDVKYEELAINPEAIVKNMMDFLQEDYDPNQLLPCYFSQSKITRSKRQEFSKLSQTINDSSVSRYQKELTAEEIGRFNQIASQELRYLGYRE